MSGQGQSFGGQGQQFGGIPPGGMAPSSAFAPGGMLPSSQPLAAMGNTNYPLFGGGGYAQPRGGMMPSQPAPPGGMLPNAPLLGGMPAQRSPIGGLPQAPQQAPISREEWAQQQRARLGMAPQQQLGYSRMDPSQLQPWMLPPG